MINFGPWVYEVGINEQAVIEGINPKGIVIKMTGIPEGVEMLGQSILVPMLHEGKQVAFSHCRVGGEDFGTIESSFAYNGIMPVIWEKIAAQQV